jgi:hypothetical protein
MKRFFLALIVSLFAMQSAEAITSLLNQSVNIYQAILDELSTDDVIPQNEFIVDIQRKTRRIEFGSAVRYLVTTVASPLTPTENDEELGLNERETQESCNHHYSHRPHHHDRSNQDIHQYIVVLRLTENPAIGPPVITILKVIPRPQRGEIIG